MSTFAILVVLHVLGAAIWTGGHLVLATCVLPRALAARDPSILERFESRYERLGMPALLVQVVTGLLLALRRVPDPSRWLAPGSVVEALVGVKVVLLALTLGLALHARLRVLPGLDAARLRVLAWHIVAVTVLSVLLAIVGVGVRTEGFALE